MSTPDNTPNQNPSSPRHRATKGQANSMTFGNLRVSRTSTWIATAITGSLLAGAFVFSQPAVSAPAACPGGATQITNQAQLVEINSDTTTRAGTYCLANNIALTGTWTPIESFTGKLYGVGRNITGLSGSQGLFSSTNGATIDGVNVAVTITGSGSNVGGLIGTAVSTSVSRSTTSGSVSGNANLGGLIGSIGDGSSPVTISNSSSSASVTATGGRAGGLIGTSNNLAQANAFRAEISDSFATGSVSGSGLTGFVGGFVGEARSMSIEKSYATGSVSSTGNFSVGGFAGAIVGSQIETSHATGNVSGASYVGGFAGEINNFDSSKISLISSSYATGNVIGTLNRVGGFVGFLHHGTVATSYSTSTVTGQASSTGGFAGEVSPGSGASGTSVIRESIAAGTVTGATSTGGFAGQITGGVVSNTVARGNVSGSTTNVGSFAGAISGGTISDSYAVGVVSGEATNKGGFVGSAGGTVNNSFWNSTANPDLPAVTGATTRNNLQQFSTFTSPNITPSWSINDGWQTEAVYTSSSSLIWGICNGTGFPYLRWANTVSSSCDHQLVFAGASGGDGGGTGGGIGAGSSVSALVFTSGDTGAGVAGIRSVVYNAKAVAEAGRTLFYSITPAVPGFRIDARTGAVRMTKAVPQGTYTLVITASDGVRFGTRTVTITVAASGQAAPRADRLVVSGFALNSKVLTPSMRKVARDFLRTRPAFSTVTCKGFTSLPAARTDARLSIDRATVVCRYIKTLRPDITTRVVEGQHIQRPGATNRKVRAVFR
jgi:hypothetical protein